MGMCGNVYLIAPGIPVGTDVDICRYSAMTAAGVQRQGPLERPAAAGWSDGRGRGVQRNLQPLQRIWRWWTAEPGESSQGTEFLAQAVNGMVLSDGTRVLARTDGAPDRFRERIKRCYQLYGPRYHGGGRRYRTQGFGRQ